MKERKAFVKPDLPQELSFLHDTPILAGSVVEQMTVTTTGQEVKDYDWSDPSFNHTWSENNS